MEHFIQISELKVTPSPDVLRTVVGSCIALCLYDRVRSIGGMVHILMPEHDGKQDTPPGRYADTGVPALIREMQRSGSRVSGLEAAFFGGASMFASGSNGTRGIGLRNADVVREILSEYRISVRDEDVGGTLGRRVVFHCETGRIDVSMLAKPSWRPAVASPADGNGRK
ncbi:MAG: chemotaxis protein CheD [bacterium]|nr:chemotaxis protein CheD [bacterium]